MIEWVIMHDWIIYYGLLPILTGSISVYFGKVLTDRNWRKAYRPRKAPKGKKKNTILLIGIGRVGKTQLVSYYRDSNPKPPNITNEFSLEKIEREYQDSVIILHFNDYRGQNFGQLVNSFIREQLNRNTYLRYGDINTLILMVDLFPFEENKTNIEKRYENFDIERVQEHIDSWNTYALDAVFALLEDESLRYVCLFVNKLDKLIIKNKAASQKEIIKAFDPLVKTLKKRAKGSKAQFDIKFGAAYNGEGLSGVKGLESELNKYGV